MAPVLFVAFGTTGDILPLFHIAPCEPPPSILGADGKDISHLSLRDYFDVRRVSIKRTS